MLYLSLLNLNQKIICDVFLLQLCLYYLDNLGIANDDVLTYLVEDYK